MTDSPSFPPPPDPTRPVPPPAADDTLAVPPPPPLPPVAPPTTELPPPLPAAPSTSEIPAPPPAPPLPTAYPPAPQANPYGNPYGSPAYAGGMVEHPQGTTILIMGILSLVVCSILGPFAWMQGNKALAEIDANPGRYSNRGNVNAGRICGIIATVIMGLALAFFLLVVVFGGLASLSAI